MIPWSQPEFDPHGQPGEPGRQHLRRLRDDPLDTVLRVVEEIGPRRATSLPEAQAAAFLDGRLRRAGLRVFADPFTTPVWPGWDGLLIGALAMVATAVYYWLPLVSLVLALSVFGAAGWRQACGGDPLISRKRASQNIIGTRAGIQSQRWRVVILAPLDSPPILGPLTRPLLEDSRPVIGRVVAGALLLAFGVIGLIDVRRLWWYIQFLPAIYMAALALAELRVQWGPTSPGAVSHTGALAVLLSSAETLAATQHTQLWMVGLGATTASGAGLADLLRRYPFEHETTLFIGLEGLGSGALAYLTREGTLSQRLADPLLLRLAAAADAADPLVDVEPRPYRGHTLIATKLRQCNARAMTISCLGGDGRVPFQASRDDTPEIVIATTLERAVRLVVELVRQIDASQP